MFKMKVNCKGNVKSFMKKRKRMEPQRTQRINYIRGDYKSNYINFLNVNVVWKF